MKSKKVFYGWWIVLGCILITSTMVPLIMSLSNKFLIQVTGEMGVSRSSFTLSNTILQALGIFLSPIVAKKLANGNMRKIQSIAIVGFALCYASYSLAQNVYHLYIASFFVGIFYLNATLIPVSMMITNWFVKKRGMAMSLAMAGIGIGGFIFSPIVTHFLNEYGWRTTYQLMALIVLIVALPTALFILHKKPEDKNLKAYGTEEDSHIAASKQTLTTSLTLSVSQSKLKLFFWLMLIGMFANGVINSGALGQFPPAMEELHGTALQATIISLYSLIGIFGKLFLGWINDKFGIVASSFVGCITFGLSFICILFGEHAYMLYAMAFLFGMGNAIGTVLPPLVTSSIFGSEKYGEAYGIVNSATQIGLSVGSLFVASIYDISGSYNTAWIILFVLTIVTLFGWVSSYIMSRKYHNNKATKTA